MRAIYFLQVLIIAFAVIPVVATTGIEGLSATEAGAKKNDTVVCKKTSDGVTCDGVKYTKAEADKAGSNQFIRDLCISIALTLCAGLMSGLTMGLMSIDLMNLRILANGGGTPTQQKYAKRILPLVKRHHLLLVTLLIANAAAMEALPIFLDRLLGPIAAVLISITAILLFGEIIPQAICTRYGLAIGANLFWLVWIIVIVLSPVAWPISLVLDVLLGGSHGTYFRRTELKELVGLHAAHSGEGHAHGDKHGHAELDMEGLSQDEINIIKGALDMTLKSVACSMTPIDKIFMLSVDDKMDDKTMDLMLENGHSRIPVYRKDRQNIIGMLIVKTLIKLNPKEPVPIADMDIHRLPIVNANMLLYPMLKLFERGHSHMAVVVDPVDHITVVGVITLEDVIEELLQEEIQDETDVYLDLAHDVKVAKVWNTMVRAGSVLSLPDGHSLSNNNNNSRLSSHPLPAGMRAIATNRASTTTTTTRASEGDADYDDDDDDYDENDNDNEEIDEDEGDVERGSMGARRVRILDARRRSRGFDGDDIGEVSGRGHRRRPSPRDRRRILPPRSSSSIAGYAAGRRGSAYHRGSYADGGGGGRSFSSSLHRQSQLRASRTAIQRAQSSLFSDRQREDNDETQSLLGDDDLQPSADGSINV